MLKMSCVCHVSVDTLLKCIELYVDHLCTSQYACDISLKAFADRTAPHTTHGLLYSFHIFYIFQQRRKNTEKIFSIFFNKGEIMIFLFVLK